MDGGWAINGIRNGPHTTGGVASWAAERASRLLSVTATPSTVSQRRDQMALITLSGATDPTSTA
jgi:hypothetical protein